MTIQWVVMWYKIGRLGLRAIMALDVQLMTTACFGCGSEWENQFEDG